MLRFLRLDRLDRGSQHRASYEDLLGPAVTRAPPPAFPRNPRGSLGFPGPATSTGSLASQRHPGKFPKVPGRRRGRVAGRLSGTVSPFRAEQGTSLETPSRARALGQEDPLEKEMATCSSVLAWKTP